MKGLSVQGHRHRLFLPTSAATRTQLSPSNVLSGPFSSASAWLTQLRAQKVKVVSRQNMRIHAFNSLKFPGERIYRWRERNLTAAEYVSEKWRVKKGKQTEKVL
jgi:hypothetical protein